MIDRSRFTEGHGDPDRAVPLSSTCTVPTRRVAELLADLCGTGQRILEIGTGSGYQAAVLAERWPEVVTMESSPRDIARLLPENVTIIPGDGDLLGTGKFDAVLVTFGARRISPHWVSQLRDGGVLVVPLKIGSCSRISRYGKTGSELRLKEVAGYANFIGGLDDGIR